MKKPRPPRAPYCLCGSLYYFSGANRRANAYFEKVKDYHTKLMQYRVELRICSRVEWYILHRRLRMKRRGGADNG